jgi:hypothetical protein
VSASTGRNIGIVLALAAIVAFLPGGSGGANLFGQILTAVFTAAIVAIGVRLYRAHRDDLFALGDRWRGVLYGSLAILLLTLAAGRRLFDSGEGTLAWFLLIGAGSYGLFATWRHFRSYG